MQKQKPFVKQASDVIDACTKSQARRASRCTPLAPHGPQGPSQTANSLSPSAGSPVSQDAASRHLQKVFSLRQRLRACSHPGAFAAYEERGLPWVETNVHGIHAERINSSLTACQGEAREAGPAAPACARARRAAALRLALSRAKCRVRS